jgi:hypothetical protein
MEAVLHMWKRDDRNVQMKWKIKNTTMSQELQNIIESHSVNQNYSVYIPSQLIASIWYLCTKYLIYFQGKFEDTWAIIRNRKSKMADNTMTKRKKTNNNSENTMQKKKLWAPQKTTGEQVLRKGRWLIQVLRKGMRLI